MLDERQKEYLIKEFETELASYVVNWEKIIKINQWPLELSDYDAENLKKDNYCKAMKELRLKEGITSKKMGECLSYTKQNISKIENNKIQNLPPWEKLEFIAFQFHVSPAYLIGLCSIEKSPDKTSCYFWENPESKYLPIKEYLADNTLINPIIMHGNSTENIIQFISEELKKDYELAYCLQKILNTQPLAKRKKLTKFIMDLSKL